MQRAPHGFWNSGSSNASGWWCRSIAGWIHIKVNLLNEDRLLTRGHSLHATGCALCALQPPPPILHVTECGLCATHVFPIPCAYPIRGVTLAEDGLTLLHQLHLLCLAEVGAREHSGGGPAARPCAISASLVTRPARNNDVGRNETHMSGEAPGLRLCGWASSSERSPCTPSVRKRRAHTNVRCRLGQLLLAVEHGIHGHIHGRVVDLRTWEEASSQLGVDSVMSHILEHGRHKG